MKNENTLLYVYILYKLYIYMYYVIYIYMQYAIYIRSPSMHSYNQLNLKIHPFFKFMEFRFKQ